MGFSCGLIYNIKKINNKYEIEIPNIFMSFIVDDSKELYEIWRIQDFSDLDKEDITHENLE